MANIYTDSSGINFDLSHDEVTTVEMAQDGSAAVLAMLGAALQFLGVIGSILGAAVAATAVVIAAHKIELQQNDKGGGVRVTVAWWAIAFNWWGEANFQPLPAPLPIQDNWRWCNKCQALSFGGGNSPGPCAAGGNHDDAGSGNYALLHDVTPGANAQGGWKWCNKCQVLCFTGSGSSGPCSAGGAHDHAGSFAYVLPLDVMPGPTDQDNWKWCNKCQALSFAGQNSLGACPAGGVHDHAGSGDYVLAQHPQKVVPGPIPIGQANWMWCNKCQVLSFAGSPSPGACPSGGFHNHAGSGNYMLAQNVTPGPTNQDNWKWCNKCQALSFAGQNSLGACPAGGVHDHAGSGDYVLAHEVMPGPNQDNWRRCNKCQVLSYAGAASLGACAAGGIHNHTGSGNYVIGAVLQV